MLEQGWQGICNPTPACLLLFEEWAVLLQCLKTEKCVPATSDNPWHHQTLLSAVFLICKVISVTPTNICKLCMSAFSQRHSDGAGKHHVVQLVNLVRHLTSSLFIIAAVPCWSDPTELLQANFSQYSVCIWNTGLNPLLTGKLLSV